MRCTCALLPLILAAAAAAASAADRPSEAAPSWATVSRIFARHCLECHGPDTEQRAAGLRLDERHSATRPLESGATAITPGKPHESEVLRRISADDDSRMPPVESGDVLSDEEVSAVTSWIRDGAIWEAHWSLVPATEHPVPRVQDGMWYRLPLDRFVQAKLEAAERRPLKAASRRTLMRRACFDLTGLPPTPQQVQEYENDDSPEAWDKVVARLLASPLYGQRWGRHWLDVARYGDSNGSDENHAYPLAWRYRNYVIDSFNDDIGFDQFVREQLAGDLLPDSDRFNEAVVATGFLAIGTKVLAEQDPVKKQADMVDEQIDTIGKALLGLTISCARCHDHKFDPIPTTDYYALAGILHSIKLEDRDLETAEYRAAMATFDDRTAQLSLHHTQLEALLAGDRDGVLDREAEDFQRGNVSVIDTGNGADIGIISDPGSQQNFVEWDFDLPADGQYVLQFRYAADQSRPGPLSINGTVVKTEAISQTTGGWGPLNQQWFTEGQFPFAVGTNVIRLESQPCMSHLDRIRLLRIDGDGQDLTSILERLTELEKAQLALKTQMPQPARAMTVAEGQVHDVQVHLRGSHLALGDIVPRGFPVTAAATVSHHQFAIEQSQSGRLQLAAWITDAEAGAGRQLARVIVNRVWQWHFGSGLVATPNNFGLQGEIPTHPKLLDWLAIQFIKDRWSLKKLHRRILTSATWRQETVSAPNDFFEGYPRQRLQAEVIRDTLLFHAGRLVTNPVTRLEGVKSQDPSPEDLRRNEEVHRLAKQRSVYLPVIRSNSYRFFSLFDFPNATTSVGRRDITNVPTQALLMMNDPFVMDQARHLARSVIRNDADDMQVLTKMFQRLFSRQPTAAEQRAVTNFLEAFKATSAAGDTMEQDAWSALCHSLLASSEFIYVE